ncbi:MAG: 16S rRNA processing protein RimM [Deltaproteobacteria bacterium]|nr:16S rRNA processing protein RimM [Deltaproteobacteria bacterium]HCH62667.1 16S rRNA processing protein RimM [Deltaproteobacteria bacterium]
MRPRRDGRFSPPDVRLGYVNGVFGLRGDVRLFLYNPDSELVGLRFVVALVAPDGSRTERGIETRPGSGRRILARIDGVTTPEDATALKGHELVLPEDELPQEADGEWYHRDLLGTPVETESGTALGVLRDIVSGPGMDTWVIRGDEGEVWVHARAVDLIEVEPGGRVVVADGAVLRLEDGD